MNTPDPPRVEVTPELLAAIADAAEWLIDAKPHARGMFSQVVTAPRVLALIERIRELESESAEYKERWRMAEDVIGELTPAPPCPSCCSENIRRRTLDDYALDEKPVGHMGYNCRDCGAVFSEKGTIGVPFAQSDKCP